MKSLKSAFQSGDKDEKSYSRVSKNANRSKSGSMWALDPQLDEPDFSQSDSLALLLEKSLLASFQRDPNFSEVTFYEILDQLRAVEDRPQREILQAIADRAAQLAGGSEGISIFAAAFSETAARRLKKIKRKEKKEELQEFENIVHNKFRKKAPQFINQDEVIDSKTKLARIRSNDSRQNKHEGSSQKNGSSSSNQGCLGKLLGSGRMKVEESRGQTNYEESVSYSAVISQSVTVRQRKPKQKGKVQKKEERGDKRQKGQIGENGKQEENKDEAFIFYRPKTNNNKKK